MFKRNNFNKSNFLILNLFFLFRSKQGYPYTPREPQKKSHLIIYLFIWAIFFFITFWLITLHSTKKQERQNLWKFEVSNEISSELILFDEYLYFTDEINQLYSILNDGSLNWKLNLDCGVNNALIVTENHVYFSTKPNIKSSVEDVSKCLKEESIYIIDRLYGEVIDTISGESLFIYGSDDQYLYYSSDLKVNKYNFNKFESSVVLDFIDVGLLDVDIESGIYVENSTLLIKNINFDIYVLDVDLGIVKWRSESSKNSLDDYLHPASYECLRTIIHRSDVIYTLMISDWGYRVNLYSFNLKEGKVLADYRVRFGDVPSSFLITDKYLYVLLNDSQVNVLSKYDFFNHRSLHLSEKIQGSMVSYQGEIYVATQSGKIIGFDENTGKKFYRYSTGHSIAGTPVINDGIIYFVTNTIENSGSIHAVRLKD